MAELHSANLDGDNDPALAFTFTRLDAKITAGMLARNSVPLSSIPPPALFRTAISSFHDGSIKRFFTFTSYGVEDANEALQNLMILLEADMLLCTSLPPAVAGAPPVPAGPRRIITWFERLFNFTMISTTTQACQAACSLNRALPPMNAPMSFFALPPSASDGSYTACSTYCNCS